MARNILKLPPPFQKTQRLSFLSKTSTQGSKVTSQFLCPSRFLNSCIITDQIGEYCFSSQSSSTLQSNLKWFASNAQPKNPFSISIRVDPSNYYLESTLMSNPLDLRRRANELWEEGIKVRDEGDVKKAELCFGSAYQTLRAGYEEIIKKQPQIKDSLHIQLSRLSVATAQVSASLFELDRAKSGYITALEWIEGIKTTEGLKCLAEVYINFADYFLQIKEYEQGEDYLQKAVKIVETHLPSRKEYLAFVLNNLAVIQAHQKKFDDSEESFLRSFDILLRVLGPMNEYTHHVFNNYGKYAEKCGDEKKIESLFNKLQNSVMYPEIEPYETDVESLSSGKELFEQWKEDEKKIAYFELYGFRKTKPFVIWEMNKFAELWVQQGLPLFPEVLEKIRSEVVDMHDPKHPSIPNLLKRTDLPYHYVKRRIQEGASEQEILNELKEMKEENELDPYFHLPNRPKKWKGRQFIDEEWVEKFEKGTLPHVPDLIEEEYYNTVSKENQVPLNLFNLDALGRFRSGDYVYNVRTQTWKNLFLTDEQLVINYENALKDYIRTAHTLTTIKQEERSSYDKWRNLSKEGKKRYLEIIDEVAEEMTNETMDHKSIEWFELLLGNHFDHWKVGDLSFMHGWQPREDDTPVSKLNQWINGVIPFPMSHEELSELDSTEVEESGYLEDRFLESHGNILSEKLIEQDFDIIEQNASKVKKAVQDRIPLLFHHPSDSEKQIADWFVVDTGVSGAYTQWSPEKRYMLTKKYFWEKLTTVPTPDPTVPSHISDIEEYGLNASLGMRGFTERQKQWEVEVKETLKQMAIDGKKLNLEKNQKKNKNENNNNNNGSESESSSSPPPPPPSSSSSNKKKNNK